MVFGSVCFLSVVVLLVLDFVSVVVLPVVVLPLVDEAAAAAEELPEVCPLSVELFCVVDEVFLSLVCVAGVVLFV